MNFGIYFEGCADAYLIAVSGFKISSALAEGSSLSYTGGDVGFVSSDPENCPIDATGIVISAYTFCLDTACTATALANFWSQDGNNLKVTRTSATTLAAEVTIFVTATYDSQTYTNTITMEITDCSAANCASCDPTSLALSSSLDADISDKITEKLTGCTNCNSGYYLSLAYSTATSSYTSQCTASATSATAVEGNKCALGLIYEKDINGDLQCTRTCSDAISGCAACDSAT